MPFCSTCGARADDGANFCTKCGRPLQGASPAQNNREQTKEKAWFEEQLRGLEPKVTCAYCLRRRPKNVCGSEQSPRYGVTVKHEDECNSFVNNPAQLHFIRAMFMDEFGNKFGLDPRQTVAEFRKAIEAGLPKDDELRARLCIGKHLYGWARSLDLDGRKWLALAETEQALSEMEEALEIDRDGGFGFFAEPKNRYQLRRLDILYAAKGAMISIEKGHGDVTSDAAAVEYWDSKLPRCAYLPSTPLLVTMSDAGLSYSRMGMRERAIQCFQSVLTAAPVDPLDEDGFEAGLRQKAKTCLGFLYEQDEQ